MTVEDLLGFLLACVEDGDATPDAHVVALVRTPQGPAGSSAVWVERPVAGVEFDDPDCDLLMGAGSREDGLTIDLIAARVRALSAPGDSVLYIRGDWETAHDGRQWRHDIPVVGAARNRDANLVGLVRQHEGVDYEIPEDKGVRA